MDGGSQHLGEDWPILRTVARECVPAPSGSAMKLRTIGFVIWASGTVPKRGSRCVRTMRRSRSSVDGRRSTTVADHSSAHEANVRRPSAGSTHSPRALVLSTLASHRSASVRRLKVFERSLPSGPR